MVRGFYLRDVSPMGLAVLGAVVLAAVALLIWVAASFISAQGNLPLRLVGPNVEKLEPGAAVVLAGEQVGEVSDTSLVQGQKVASVVIESQFVGQMVDGCKFRVVSGNQFVPGNLIVSVEPPADYGGRVVLAPNMMIRVEGLILPAEIPKKFYLLVGAGLILVCLCALGLSIVKHLSKYLVIALVAAIVIIGVWMLTRERITTPSMPVANEETAAQVRNSSERGFEPQAIERGARC